MAILTAAEITSFLTYEQLHRLISYDLGEAIPFFVILELIPALAIGLTCFSISFGIVRWFRWFRWFMRRMSL